MRFQQIENLVDEILSTERAIFFGIEHDEVSFHENLAQMVVSLNKKYTIHLLLETDDTEAQKTLKSLLMFSSTSLKKAVIDKNLQFPYFVAAVAQRATIRVKGIDPANQADIREMHDTSTSSKRLSELLLKRATDGTAMITSIQAELSAAGENDKYIILGGPMHGDVPKALAIKNIQIAEINQLQRMAINFSQAPAFKRVADSQAIKPDYAFFYKASEVNNIALNQTLTQLSYTSSDWLPAYAQPHFLDAFEAASKHYSEGIATYKAKDLTKAVECFKLSLEAIATYSNLVYTKERASFSYALAKASLESGQVEQAKLFAEIAYDFRCLVFGKDDPITHKSKALLDACHVVVVPTAEPSGLMASVQPIFAIDLPSHVVSNNVNHETSKP